MFSKIQPRRAEGYTLLEVMLVLTLFSVLCGGIFGIVQSTMESIMVVRGLIRTQGETDALLDVLRQACSRLPVTAVVRAEKRPESSSSREVQFQQAPGTLQWGERWQDPMAVTVVLAARKQEDGRWVLAARKFNPMANDRAHAELMPWLPLAGGFSEMEWSFQDPGSGEWKDEWKDPIRRPLAVALWLRRPTEAAGSRTVFYIPQVQTNALPHFGSPS